jgi:conjugal transfer pilin signal peptidase TrbI
MASIRKWASRGSLSQLFWMRSPFVVKKEPWRAYWIKALTALSLVILLGTLLSTRFRLLIDPQAVRCIPAFTVYLLDQQDVELKRGKLYAFRSRDLSPLYPKGTPMLKYLRGLPGDTIEILENEQVWVNGHYTESGLSVATVKLGMRKADFVGKTILSDDQYWFLGTSPQSFDSRYWGSISAKQVTGRAYPLF